ncbi:MAG: hypothetical protein ACTHN5_12320 [Phycisphaerae bacterium]
MIVLADIAMVLLAALFGITAQLFVRGLRTGRHISRFALGGALACAGFGFMVTIARAAFLGEHSPSTMVLLVFVLFFLFSNPASLRAMLFDDRRFTKFGFFLLDLLFAFIFVWFGAELARVVWK